MGRAEEAVQILAVLCVAKTELERPGIADGQGQIHVSGPAPHTVVTLEQLSNHLGACRLVAVNGTDDGQAAPATPAAPDCVGDLFKF